MFTDFKYKIYIPSLKRETDILPLLVEQYKEIIKCAYEIPFLNIGFHLALNKMLETNLVDISLTEFDKFVITLFIRKNDLQLNTTITGNIEHPDNITIDNNIYGIPTLVQENEYLNHILSLESSTNDDLLFAEVAKYLKLNLSFTDKINFIKNLSLETLAQIIRYIDSFKNKIKSTTILPYNISMFVE